MLFYTPQFLIFFAILLLTLLVVARSQPRKLVLLIGSYVFYMWWNPAFILLILFSTFVDFLVGRRMVATQDDSTRRLLLGISLTANLGMLGFFKYADFFGDSTLYLLRLLGYEASWVTLNITLPVGISFYTFQTMSYTLDLYRRQIPASRSPLDFALFVAFFPQLVAGPIVRAADFLPQLRNPVRLHCNQQTVLLILRGLAKKVLIADNLSVFADQVFSAPELWPSLIIWLGTICFAVQIYCDFSGYSDIAIGIARILGFALPPNFDHPYVARNPSDFWRRWHISLSSWLRDYLYISAGGNRRGRLMTYRNLMLTMLLGGLWHGASWNFVVWGLLHGLLLVGHRAWSEWRGARGRTAGTGGLATLVSTLSMQFFVLLTWITFRLTDFGDMTVALRKFVFFDFDFGLANIGLGSMSFFSSLLILGAFCALHAFSFRVGGIDRWLGGRVALGSAVAFFLGAGFYLLWPLVEAPFIYFQF